MIAQLRGFRGDSNLLVLTLIITLLGLVCLYSATATSEKSLMKTEFGKQVIWLFLGMVVLTISIFTPLNVLMRGSYLFYAFSMGLLILLLFVAPGNIKRWIMIGPLSFQPSELAKVTTLLALARNFSRDSTEKSRWIPYVSGLGIVLLPFYLILKEPDIGTALVFLALYGGMVVWSGIGIQSILFLLMPIGALLSGFHVISFIGFMVILMLGLLLMKKGLWKIVGIGLGCLGLGLLGPIVWARLEPYQQQRIHIFLGMQSDPHGAAYQVIQSKVAIGSGGILGKGFLQGSQTHLRFLPEQHTDFIFSVLGEEFGFMGVTVMFLLFYYFFHRMIIAIIGARNRFAGFTAMGCMSILAFQFMVNIGMTVGLVPVTGLPLPLLSYGGSSLLMTMCLIGLTVNVSNRYYHN